MLAVGTMGVQAPKIFAITLATPALSVTLSSAVILLTANGWPRPVALVWVGCLVLPFRDTLLI